MSILTTEQYFDDADCPELCDHDSFTIIDCKDAVYSLFDLVSTKFDPLKDDGFWDCYSTNMKMVAESLGVSLDEAYEMDQDGILEFSCAN